MPPDRNETKLLHSQWGGGEELQLGMLRTCSVTVCNQEPLVEALRSPVASVEEALVAQYFQEKCKERTG